MVSTVLTQLDAAIKQTKHYVGQAVPWDVGMALRGQPSETFTPLRNSTHVCTRSNPGSKMALLNTPVCLATGHRPWYCTVYDHAGRFRTPMH